MKYNNFNYVSRVMKRRSFPDFFSTLGYRVDYKEWSEIFGMYKVIAKNVYDHNFEPDFVFDVGCGKRPTLATYLALNVKNFRNIIAIDPQLDTSLCTNPKIEGVTLVKDYLSDVNLRALLGTGYKSNAKALICCNHAHVSKQEIEKLCSVFDEWVYITCPCCKDNKFDDGEFVIDKNVQSDKNVYYVSKSFK